MTVPLSQSKAESAEGLGTPLKSGAANSGDAIRGKPAFGGPIVDPFALLGLPRRYDVDLRVAEKTHRELSRALHPDRYASAGATERREALNKAADVNEAWRIIRDPVRRAEVLFALAGVEVGETKEPKPDPELLMEVLEKREALADAQARVTPRRCAPSQPK